MNFIFQIPKNLILSSPRGRPRYEFYCLLWILFFIGRPRYLPLWASSMLSNTSLTSFLIMMGVFLAKNMADLSKLTTYPVAWPYCWMISFIFRASFLLALQHKSESSAKNKWETMGLSLLILIPVSCFLSTAFLSKLEKPSVHKMNK